MLISFLSSFRNEGTQLWSGPLVFWEAHLQGRELSLWSWSVLLRVVPQKPHMSPGTHFWINMTFYSKSAWRRMNALTSVIYREAALTFMNYSRVKTQAFQQFQDQQFPRKRWPMLAMMPVCHASSFKIYKPFKFPTPSPSKEFSDTYILSQGAQSSQLIKHFVWMLLCLAKMNLNARMSLIFLSLSHFAFTVA